MVVLNNSDRPLIINVGTQASLKTFSFIPMVDFEVVAEDEKALKAESFFAYYVDNGDLIIKETPKAKAKAE